MWQGAVEQPADVAGRKFHSAVHAAAIPGKTGGCE
jgi:hypothetical protein